ncbi:MAG: Gldg family protein [Lewinellaceae bacterium]|nr:Gldg family protein [Phaeodactylibacter sp.]MCB9041413.1 Gldg family protein [Lewinellaceae bacterium]
MKNKTVVSILLIIAIIVVANLISQQFFFRLDLTENDQYTLSPATKDILRNLEDPVTVTAYFSENMPPNIEKARRDFQEMLVEYANLSKGYVDYQFINPDEDEEKQQAAQEGIQPVMITMREKDQAQQQQAFLGAVVQMGGQKETIPFIQPGAPIEYELSTSIKKLAVKEKPSIGLVQGHGEPTLSELAQVVQSLSILYRVENVDLENEASIPDRFRAIAIVAPSDTIPPSHLAKLDEYLSRGSQLFIALNTVEGDLQNAQGRTVYTGLEGWLQQKGVEVAGTFIIDAQCGSVQVRQQQGFLTFNTAVQFPYLPVINNFPEHPITKGLEQVILSFASPVRFVGDSTARFTPIAQTSVKSGIATPPIFFDINKQWTDADFPMSNLTVGGVLEGNLVGNAYSRIVVIGDGDFPVSGQGQQGGDNISLMVNSIDWLSDDTGLIELRTKGVASRPIDQEYLSDEASGKRTFLKYLNFGLPLLLVLIYGFIRVQQQKNRRLRRMQERYV